MGISVEGIVFQGLSEILEPLRGPVTEHWRRFSSHGGDFPWNVSGALDCLRTLPRAWSCSEFLAHSCVGQPELLAELIENGTLLEPRSPARSHLEAETANVTDEEALKRCLRRFRRRELMRIAWRDLAGWADLEEVLSSLSKLGDACISAALHWLYARATDRYGVPIGEESGNPVPLIVLGLGKLGGCELNFSSDVDLIFAYPEGGNTTSRAALSNHEFFLRLGRRLINVLSEATSEGIVLRVDMRLRPNGNSGPLALNYGAMEQYYQLHGREWERYALIKARVVSGDAAEGGKLLGRLRPFVYRRYLDYGSLEAMRELKLTIDREVLRKGMQEDIKRGPGGIREVEFIAQVFQLIRGSREPELRGRSLLKTLNALAHKKCLSAQAVEELSAAYRFLRNTENRLQMIADRQTHKLPRDGTDQLRLASAMGFSDWPSFKAALTAHRESVQRHFDQVFAAPRHDTVGSADQILADIWSGKLGQISAHKHLDSCGFPDPVEAYGLLRRLRESPAYSAFSREGRTRLDKLMPLLLAAAGRSREPMLTLARLVKLVEAIGRRSAYFVLLVENPKALTQLVELCTASAWIASWISQNPVLLDELLHPAGVYAPLSREALSDEIRRSLASIAEKDLEAQMDTLREFRHRHLLRVAAADVGPGLEPEQVGRHLSDIAEVTVGQTVEVAYRALLAKHGQPYCDGSGSVQGFAIIGYGKLGGRELGYGSDLDMIFLYQGCDGRGETKGPRPLPNEQFFFRLGQRLIHILTARTRAGQLYEVDVRLRPSGQSGPLVTSLPAFQKYQRDSAWTWEHQALVRARPIIGPPSLLRAFQVVRREVLCARRDPSRLQEEIKDMRMKIAAAKAGRHSETFDVKNDRGGMVDIEFMVQYWVLRFAAEYPKLTEHTDNISLLQVLAGLGLIANAHKNVLIEAYRRYLTTEYRLKLTEQRSVPEKQTLGELPDRVQEIWIQALGGE